MKKIGLLHGELSKLIAEMAHNDMILIGDAGMPVPKDVQLIDLAVFKGIPSFMDVLKAVLSELYVGEGIIGMEINLQNPDMKREIIKIVDNNFSLIEMPHSELKELSKSAKAVIRTGEFTPYANIILKAGVLF